MRANGARLRPASRVDGRRAARHRRATFRTKCCRSSVVERILGKAEVVSSILTGSAEDSERRD